ncbi:transposase [Corallococcus exercitus]|uniref:Transposase n=1 Tax=Corallococcus exercitus TaxID=2316736 RepID=A0A7Y4KF92_9BACT|nr:transposase [Corallococcus exercitus]
MARKLVPDAPWERVRPLLPPHPPRPRGGRPPADDRACLRGIQWEELPHEVFGVSGMTCWRRLRDREKAGVLSTARGAARQGMQEAQARPVPRGHRLLHRPGAEKGTHWAQPDGPRQATAACACAMTAGTTSTWLSSASLATPCPSGRSTPFLGTSRFGGFP